MCSVFFFLYNLMKSKQFGFMNNDFIINYSRENRRQMFIHKANVK